MKKIKFFKTISCILIFAAFSILYVHQQVEIYKTSFMINSNQKDLSFLLDQYRSLVYNLSRLESPERIEEELFVNEITLCMPKAENIRRFNRVSLEYNESELKTVEKVSFLASVFDRFSTKAEAKDKL